MAKKKPASREECSSSFEQSLEELEEIVAELEGGKLDLSDALLRYELGVKHLKACQQLLQRAERKIALLSGVDADGNPITAPFDEAEFDTLQSKAEARGQRRTAAGRTPTRKIALPDDDVDGSSRLF